ncbi:MAG: DNA-formamidopyrimidine glycosylase family protein [Myxococcales bacterium]|nr:DNA-formamidopyrimidine glycosylase family protein [Myxococcales bacterium]MDP3504994.1 DNA-formamidopyrimidine glycosylase family protein [Myxococcales bacterium]
MPEGDTLHITANTLRPALVGKVVRRIDFARLAGDSSILVGTTVIEVEAEGKNLLVRFDNGLVLHTHLKMPGIWHLYRPGEAWRRSPSAARVVLEVDGFQAVCFSAPVVRVLEEASVRRDRQLANLGPDLLAETFDAGVAVSRLRALADWPLGVAVMHQAAVAGIGNVYKSELLFLEKLNPFEPVSSVSDEALAALLERARDLMQRNVARPGQKRTTRFEGKSDATRVWVYRRKGMPCFRCGTTIRMKRQGEALRSTYFCPTCEGVTPEELAMLFRSGP